jgi:hypothetical protein
VFPAGTTLTPLSGEIDSLSGVPAGCVDTLFDINPVPDHNGYLVAQTLNPSTATLPLALSPDSAMTIATAEPIKAYFLLCLDAQGNPLPATPGATGKIVLRVDYPPTVIP